MYERLTTWSDTGVDLHGFILNDKAQYQDRLSGNPLPFFKSLGPPLHKYIQCIICFHIISLGLCVYFLFLRSANFGQLNNDDKKSKL